MIVSHIWNMLSCNQNKYQKCLLSSLGEKVKKDSIYQGIAVFRHTFFYTDNCQEEIGLHCTGAASAFPYRPPSWCPVLVARSFVFCVVFCRSLFVLFLLAIVLSVLRIMDYDYPFGIFKLFLLVKLTRYLLLVNSYHCMYFQYFSGKKSQWALAICSSSFIYIS